VQWDLTPFTATAGAYIAVDDTDGIVAVSNAAADLLRYESPEQLLGHRVVSIIPARYRQAHVAGFTLHLLNGRDPLLATPVVLPLRRRDGTEVFVTVRITKHHTEDGRAVFLAAMDSRKLA
jgi:PAS domain S-box-containing protein